MASREKNPMNQLSAHIDRAWDRMSAGDAEGALRSAEKAAELDRESPEVQNLLGYVHAASGNAEKAIEHYKQAIDLDESFVEAMLNASEVLLHPLHDWDAAIAMIDSALEWIEDETELADALLLKFDGYLGKGDKAGAEAVLKRVPKKLPENAGIDAALGRAWFELGNPTLAEPFLERAIKVEPLLADAHYYIGLCRESRKDLAGMAVAFLHARDAELKQGYPASTMSQEDFEAIIRDAMQSVPEEFGPIIDGAFVIVSDVPGAEVVAEGVDPRIPVLLDGLSAEGEVPKASRIFVYRRNIERMGMPSKDDVARAIAEEIRQLFFGSVPLLDERPN
jgi:tetratricopeptide (TPR) repeat protein